MNVRATSHDWQTCYEKSEQNICRLLQPRLQPVATNCTTPVHLWQHKRFGILPHVQRRLAFMKTACRQQGKFHSSTEILLTYCDRLLFFFHVSDLPTLKATQQLAICTQKQFQVQYNVTISPHKSIVHSLINVHRTNSSVAHFNLMINCTILKYVFR